MSKISTKTHEFRRGEVAAGVSCLYTSIRYVNRTLTTMDNKCVRSLVADYILRNKTIHDVVINSGTSCKTVEEYCCEIKRGNLCGGKPELQALAVLCRIVIRLVSMTKTAEQKYVKKVFEYGNNIQSITECVHILYDEENKHYDPLSVIHKQHSDEEIMIFNRDDEIVISLLNQFIPDKREDDTSIQSDHNNSAKEAELPTKRELSNEIEHISDLVIVNLPKKQKTQDYGDILSAHNYKKQTSIVILNKHDDPPVEQQSIADLPTGSNDEDPKEHIRLQTEPALNFRGRTSHEFKPLKPLKRNGQPSVPQAPRYFSDRENNHYLSLLIPEKYLLSVPAPHYLEICLVTREINGHTYYHPYFKLQGHPTDKQIPDENPKYLLIDEKDLKNYSKGIKELQLKLVVVMHTNNELMKSQQPLPIFSSSTNDEFPITTKFDSADTFKKAYRLHDLRFAITLCSQTPGDKDFRRYEDIQYISYVSTEDKTTRIVSNNISQTC